MDLKRALLAFAAFCVSPGISAATYVYKGPCGAGACANYALGEKITGQFMTAVPLAPNLSNQNVLPSVTSYSFTDGVDTYSSADPNTRVDDFVISTDSHVTRTSSLWILPADAGATTTAYGLRSPSSVTLEVRVTCRWIVSK